MISDTSIPVSGNANDAAKDTRGWFLGHFMPGEANPLRTGELEEKGFHVLADWLQLASLFVAELARRGSELDPREPRRRRLSVARQSVKLHRSWDRTA